MKNLIKEIEMGQYETFLSFEALVKEKYSELISGYLGVIEELQGKFSEITDSAGEEYLLNLQNEIFSLSSSLSPILAQVANVQEEYDRFEKIKGAIAFSKLHDLVKDRKKELNATDKSIESIVKTLFKDELVYVSACHRISRRITSCITDAKRAMINIDQILKSLRDEKSSTRT